MLAEPVQHGGAETDKAGQKQAKKRMKKTKKITKRQKQLFLKKESRKSLRPLLEQPNKNVQNASRFTRLFRGDAELDKTALTA